MPRSIEAIEPRVGVVIGHDPSSGHSPLTMHAHANAWIRFDVANVASVASVLSDDPASAAHDVHPYDRSASLSGPASYGLDQDMAAHETQSHDQLHWGVEEVTLDAPNSLTLAFVIAAPAHERIVPTPAHRRNDRIEHRDAVRRSRCVVKGVVCRCSRRPVMGHSAEGRLS